MLIKWEKEELGDYWFQWRYRTENTLYVIEEIMNGKWFLFVFQVTKEGRYPDLPEESDLIGHFYCLSKEQAERQAELFISQS